MAILDFPSSPSIGQIYPSPAVTGQPQYTYDGEKWTGGTSTGAIYISDSPPAAPVGSLWYESDTGGLYVRYNDGDSLQWVAILGGIGDAVRYGAQTLTTAQKQQARANIDAAPFEAMQEQNLLINGFMDVSQEFAYGTAVASGGGCAADQWYGSGPANVNSSNGGVGGFGIERMLGQSTAAGYTVVASNAAYLFQNIEGLRCAKISWGNSYGIPVSLGFWVYSNVGGVMTVTARNVAGNRSYCVPISVPAATWVYRTATFPPCPDGVWPLDNTAGLQIYFSWLPSTSLLASAANTWLNVNAICAPTQTTMFTAVGQGNYITGVTLVPGNVPVSQAQCQMMRRDPAVEMMLCRRYFIYETFANFWFHPLSLTDAYRRRDYRFSPPMRAPPTVTVTGITTGAFAGGMPGCNASFVNYVELAGDLTGAGYSYLKTFKANARM